MSAIGLAPRPLTVPFRMERLSLNVGWLRSTRARDVAYLSAVLLAITGVEYVFAYGNPAISAVLALGLTLALALISALAPLRPALVRCTDALALVPIYILLTASLPWFFFNQQLWVPAVYSLVLALCLWHALGRGTALPRLVGLHLRARPLVRMVAVGLLIGIPTGVVEYLVLRVAAPAPSFELNYLVRDTAYMLFFVGLGEELLFRGIIQTDLSKAVGWKWGLFLASFLFMVMHLTWRSVPELGFVFVAGGLMGVLFNRTGNLMASVAMHAMNNVILVSVAPYVVPALGG
jgi:uncharacterized protein